MQVSRTRPTTPFLMWTMDGWDVELLYQKRGKDKKGHMVTTYHHRLTVVVVLDPFCNYPVGYAIGHRESPTLIREAMRDAMKHTQSLFGELYMTNQLQSDRYQLKHMLPTYKAFAACDVTPTRAHNGKSKVIEPYFKYLNSHYCQMNFNWAGYGVTSAKYKQPNSDALNTYKKQFPNEGECRDQIARIIEAERTLKHNDFVAGFAKLPESRKHIMSKHQFLLHFGHDNGTTIRIAADGTGINPHVNGILRRYDCFDINFRQHRKTDWIIKYDPDDAAEVLAVSEDGSLQFMLQKKYLQPMAKAEQNENDKKELRRIQQFNRTLETDVTEKLADAYEDVDEIFRHPRLENSPIKRLIISDSNGQYKDRRNDARLTQADIDDVDARAVEKPNDGTLELPQSNSRWNIY